MRSRSLIFETWTRWPPCCRRHFLTHFPEWKLPYLERNSTEFIHDGPGRDNIEKRLGAEDVTSHDPTQCWPRFMRPNGVTVSYHLWYRLHHDDVIKWKHFSRYLPFVRGIHRSPVNSPHKGQWRGALMFSLFCVWINGWINSREAGDLRRYRAHYDVTVMMT